MLSAFYQGDYEYWELRHKVTFDPARKLILINPGETVINLQRDLYSAAKEWLLIDENQRYRMPIRVVGGDLLPDGSPLGRTFFLTNGWRILLEFGLTVEGNLYSDNFPSPYVETPGISAVRSKFSNIIDISGGGAVDVSQIWDAVDAIEAGLTPRQALRLIAAVLAGKISGAPEGPIVIRNVGDTKTRVTATVDSSGNRLDVETDAS